MTHKPLPSVLRMLVVTNVFALLYILMVAVQPGGEAGLRLWANLSRVAVSMFAAGAAWLSWHSGPAEERPTWKWIAGGMCVWAGAELAWAYAAVSGADSPMPSIAGVLWLSGYGLIGAALIRHLLRVRALLRPGRVALGLLGGGSLAWLMLVAVVEPAYLSHAGLYIQVSILDLIYPVLHVLLATGGFLAILAVDRWQWWRPWLFIGCALALWGFTDAWRAVLNLTGSYGLNGFSALTVDIPYALAYLFFGIGCIQGVALRRLALSGARKELAATS